MTKWLTAILVGILAFLASMSAYALNTPILGGGTSLPSTSATNYSMPGADQLTWNATEANSRGVIAVAGTVTAIYARVETAPSSGKSWVFTVVKNGVDSGVTCTIADANTTCNDTGHTSTFAAGDTISIKSVPSGTPTSPTSIQFGLNFSSTSLNEQPLMGSTRGTTLATSGTQYGLLAGTIPAGSTLNLMDAPCPVSGTFDKLYVELVGSPGVGTGYTLTVLKNGSATSITCDVTGTNTTCNDTTHSVSCVQDDLMAMQFTIQSGTPTARTARYGLRWVPTTTGKTIFLHNDGSSPNTGGATRYSFPPGGSAVWASAENTALTVMPGSWTWRDFVIQLNTAPGGAASYTFRGRKNSGNGNQVVTISGSNTSGSDLSNTDSLVAGDTISASSVGASAPSSTVSKWGWVMLDASEPTPTPTPTPTSTPTNTPTPTPTATPTPTNTPTPTPQSDSGLPMMGIGGGGG